VSVSDHPRALLVLTLLCSLRLPPFVFPTPAASAIAYTNNAYCSISYRLYGEADRIDRKWSNSYFNIIGPKWSNRKEEITKDSLLLKIIDKLSKLQQNIDQ
jgi:hypothetical protein